MPPYVQNSNLLSFPNVLIGNFKQMRKAISIFVLAAFTSTSVYVPAYAQTILSSDPSVQAMLTKQQGILIHLSPEFTPAHLQGLTIHPDNALQFDFLINRGDTPLDEAQKKEQYGKLVKYFLASLTIPDDDQWVNLSPYEKSRIIKDDFGKTEMGRDLLSQDYILKQITSSLIYPESNLGKRFWDRVYERAYKEYGATNIPVNTFNKVWIIPDEAAVYESGNTVYILRNHLKVMLEEDYLSLKKHENKMSPPNVSVRGPDKAHSIASQVIREIILPELEKEVNEGQNFANLRQIYSGMILATWYKYALKESLLGKIYANQAKVQGVTGINSANSSVIASEAKQSQQQIYKQYLRAFKKGVFNYIKEDVDKYTNEIIPRKYFSGGMHGFDRGVVTGSAVDSGFQEARVLLVTKSEAEKLPQDMRDKFALVLSRSGEGPGIDDYATVNLKTSQDSLKRSSLRRVTVAVATSRRNASREKGGDVAMTIRSPTLLDVPTAFFQQHEVLLKVGEKKIVHIESSLGPPYEIVLERKDNISYSVHFPGEVSPRNLQLDQATDFYKFHVKLSITPTDSGFQLVEAQDKSRKLFEGTSISLEVGESKEIAIDAEDNPVLLETIHSSIRVERRANKYIIKNGSEIKELSILESLFIPFCNINVVATEEGVTLFNSPEPTNRSATKLRINGYALYSLKAGESKALVLKDSKGLFQIRTFTKSASGGTVDGTLVKAWKKFNGPGSSIFAVRFNHDDTFVILNTNPLMPLTIETQAAQPSKQSTTQVREISGRNILNPTVTDTILNTAVIVFEGERKIVELVDAQSNESVFVTIERNHNGDYFIKFPGDTSPRVLRNDQTTSGGQENAFLVLVSGNKFYFSNRYGRPYTRLEGTSIILADGEAKNISMSSQTASGAYLSIGKMSIKREGNIYILKDHILDKKLAVNSRTQINKYQLNVVSTPEGVYLFNSPNPSTASPAKMLINENVVYPMDKNRVLVFRDPHNPSITQEVEFTILPSGWIKVNTPNESATVSSYQEFRDPNGISFSVSFNVVDGTFTINNLSFFAFIIESKANQNPPGSANHKSWMDGAPGPVAKGQKRNFHLVEGHPIRVNIQRSFGGVMTLFYDLRGKDLWVTDTASDPERSMLLDGQEEDVTNEIAHRRESNGFEIVNKGEYAFSLNVEYPVFTPGVQWRGKMRESISIMNSAGELKEFIFFKHSKWGYEMRRSLSTASYISNGEVLDYSDFPRMKMTFNDVDGTFTIENLEPSQSITIEGAAPVQSESANTPSEPESKGEQWNGVFGSDDPNVKLIFHETGTVATKAIAFRRVGDLFYVDLPGGHHVGTKVNAEIIVNGPGQTEFSVTFEANGTFTIGNAKSENPFTVEGDALIPTVPTDLEEQVDVFLKAGELDHADALLKPFRSRLGDMEEADQKRVDRAQENLENLREWKGIFDGALANHEFNLAEHALTGVSHYLTEPVRIAAQDRLEQAILRENWKADCNRLIAAMNWEEANKLLERVDILLGAEIKGKVHDKSSYDRLVQKVKDGLALINWRDRYEVLFNQAQAGSIPFDDVLKFLEGLPRPPELVSEIGKNITRTRDARDEFNRLAGHYYVLLGLENLFEFQDEQFKRGEERGWKNPQALVDALRNDLGRLNKTSILKSGEPILSLNAVEDVENLYTVMDVQPPEVLGIVRRLQSGKKLNIFFIRRLNRLLIEARYPSLCPKNVEDEPIRIKKAYRKKVQEFHIDKLTRELMEKLKTRVNAKFVGLEEEVFRRLNSKLIDSHTSLDKDHLSGALQARYDDFIAEWQWLSDEFNKGQERIKELNEANEVLSDPGKRAAYDLALVAEHSDKAAFGGIDLNAANLNLQIQRDGRGVPLPLSQQDMAQLSRITGFVPEIISIQPAVNLPILSEIQQKFQSASKLAGV